MSDVSTIIKVTADVAGAISGLGLVQNAMQRLGTSTSSISSAMRTQGKSLENFGNSMYTFGRRANSSISEPLQKIGEKALDVGANLVAFENRYKITLGNMAKESTEWAEKTGKAINMTGIQVEEEVLKFDLLAKAMGKPAKEALHFSEKMTNLSNDLATFYNIDPEVATNSLAGMMKGKYKAVQALGVLINSQTLAEELHREGSKKTVKQLSMEEKATLSLNLALYQTKGALGQAEKQRNSYRAGMILLKGTMDDLYEKVFVAMQPTIKSLVATFSKWADVISKISPQTMTLLVKIGLWLIILPRMIMWFGMLMTSIGKLWSLFGVGISVIGKVYSAFIWLSKVSWIETLILKVWYALEGFTAWLSGLFMPIITGVFTAITTAFEALAVAVGVSVGWLIVIIAGIIAVLVLIVVYHKQIWAFIVKTWNALVPFLSGVWKSITKTLGDVWNSFVKALINIWHSIADPLWKGIKSGISSIKSVWDGAWNGAVNTFSKFINSIKNLWSNIKNLFKMPTITMTGSFDPAQMVRGNLPHLGVKWNASGGIFEKASVIGVGEAGSEAVIPLSNKSKVAPFAQAVASLMPQIDGSKSGHKNGDVVIQVASLVVREEADINKIAEKLYKLQEKSRRGRGVMASV